MTHQEATVVNQTVDSKTVESKVLRTIDAQSLTVFEFVKEIFAYSTCVPDHVAPKTLPRNVQVETQSVMYSS